MKDYRNFYRSQKKKKTALKTREKRDEQGRVHIAFHTEIFNNVSEKLLVTNSEYADLKEDIVNSLEPYRTKEKIVLDVFETKESDEFGRESTIIGFNRYINACRTAQMRSMLGRMLFFAILVVFGVLVEFIIYGIPSLQLPGWVVKSIEVYAGLLIWQFGGFMAFEFAGELREVHRYRQITEIEYQFKHFE